MPTYRGLNVLEYEFLRLQSIIKKERAKLDALHLCRDLYTDDIFDSLVQTYTSLIDSYSEKSTPLEDKLKEFRSAYTSSGGARDDAPLEYLYQVFLQKNLHLILKKIRTAYCNNRDYLLSNGIAHFDSTATKIAIANLYQHQIGYIVSGYLAECQIEELRALPQGIPGAIHAIEEKYNYFEARLECCPEIGKLLKDLV